MVPAWRARALPDIGKAILKVGCLVGTMALDGWVTRSLRADELRESLAEGSSTQVRIELKAEGLFRPGLPSSIAGDDVKMPKPLTLEVKTRLIFNERIAKPSGAVAAGETRRRSVRWVTQAASAINGEVRPTSGVLRPELALLIAERRASDGPVLVVSPSGPLSRPELELVQGPGDPLVLADLLPAGDVTAGRSWSLPASAALSLSGYDSVKRNSLEAVAEQIDASTARIRIKGEVEGSVLGGSGTIACAGFFTFDRAAGLVDRLEVQRTEKREAGPVEAGLDVKSTLTVVRRPAPLPSELADAILANLSLDVTPERQVLQQLSPDGRYNFLHDRQWHTYWEDRKLTVLKRLVNGKVVAQCNLAAGPPAGKGRHQDLTQFRDDIRRSLRQRFVQFLGAGEVDGDPAGGFRYKVGVQGREGELGVVWYYYLIASPEGEQVLATFTLAEQDVKAFGGQDLELIGSLQWFPAAAGPAE